MMCNVTKNSILQVMDNIKRQAKESSDLPCQIIQQCTTSVSPHVAAVMPSIEAIRQRIRRVRHGQRPAEPRTLAGICVPDVMRVTFSGELFLIKDKRVGNDGFLMFTTVSDLQKLESASFWIMDGTFKTVPKIFYQLYTIHAPVLRGSYRTFPFVYILMTGKSRSLYESVFEELLTFCEENGLALNPSMVLTDFELGAINACKSVFPNARNKACYFHFAHCIWRQVQNSGLAKRYCRDEEFNLKIRQLSALAFLPAEEIPDAFDLLKLHMPDEARQITEWFESNYVRGRIRKRLRNGVVVRAPTLFPPELWSTYDCMQEGFPRSQNSVEAWHRRWESLIGGSHVGVYRMIEEFRREQRRVQNQCERISIGEEGLRRTPSNAVRIAQLEAVINDRASRPRVLDYLLAIARTLRL
ncbi:hypothetical protein M513_03356 [Trichuris suis]|uniref:MULE transposase domain-containing protein n=1 Tax=Trichuris suis TaxID=68888 RepID=A0A085MEG2_9BILA|nr:hypothetical protein M513_03356 [Trichuris suis]